MIQYTVENHFILYLFETLLAGLLFLVSVWSYLEEPKSTAKYSRVGQIVAFFCLSGFFLLKCLLSLLLSTGTTFPWFEAVSAFVSGLESLFILCLLVSLLTARRLQQGLLGLSFPVFLLATVYLEPFQTLGNLYPIVVLNFLLMCSLFFILFSSRVLRGSLFHVAVAIFALSYLCEIVFLFGFSLPYWNAQHAAKLLGLLCFALQLEREQHHIFAQFFIRLNLVFIFSASVFMLIISDQERKNYLRYSETTLQELAEFIRGHVIYYRQAGEMPAKILEDDRIRRKIVSEFGRVPDLKEVKIDVLGHQVRMAIDEDGMISYENGQGLFSIDPELVYDYERQTVTVLRVPVVLEGMSLGTVELAEDLLSLTQRISGQMRFIFSSFTLIVLITFVSLGLVVMRAHKIIREQYKKLDDRKRELMRASHLAAVGELVDGVAHEVNNPTGVILIRSESALSSDSLVKSVREDLREIRTQATRMTKIVRNLLAFSRPKPFRMVDVDLNELISRSMVLLNSYQEMRGFQTRLDLEPSLPLIPGDPDRLEQVLINIGKNAVDAMPKGGILTLSTKVEENFVKLEVKDTGIGMSPDVVERIFDPFFTTKETGEGTGLGLAISHRIVEDHKGRVEVQSEAGEGTIFRIFLPLRRRNQ